MPRMNPLLATVLTLTALATLSLIGGCAPGGGVRNPFVKEAPFVPTAVPADFALVVNENHDTFYSRQHIEQNISAADMMSNTKYTTFRDLNNAVSNQFSTEQPLNDVQLQSMWNEVAKNHLLEGGTTWINWRSDADLYRRNMHTVRIRANGIAKTYRQSNGFAGSLRGLMLQVDAVRLPLTQNAAQPVYGTPHSVETPAPAPLTPPEQPAMPSEPTAPDAPVAPDATTPVEPPATAPAPE